jgi:hypothetical protein
MRVVQSSVLSKNCLCMRGPGRGQSVSYWRRAERCSILGRGWEFFSSPPRPDRLWGPPSLLYNGCHGLFQLGESGRGVKVTTHLHLVPRSKNSWSYTSTPQYVFMAWCSVKKSQRQLYLYFTLLYFTCLLRNVTWLLRAVIAHSV